MQEALEENDLSSAADYAEKLGKAPDATFEDRLRALDVLGLANSESVAACLTSAQEQAASSPEYVAKLVTWMINHNLSMAALDWCKTLKTQVLADSRVRTTRAEACASLNDWASVRPLVSGSGWSTFEFLRRAYLARLAQEDGLDDDRKNQWLLAMEEVKDKPQFLLMLAQIAAGWHWDEQQEAALWKASDGTGDAAWKALIQLDHRMTAAGNSAGLYQAVQRMAHLKPNDQNVTNNLVLLSTLRGANLRQSAQQAETLYRKSPHNTSIASTYAFVLHTLGRNADGLKILQSLPETELQTPAVALYYGILLAAAGDGQKASHYLSLVDEKSLLPEEKKLLTAARQQIAVPAPQAVNQ
jgi:hypothetical protein